MKVPVLSFIDTLFSQSVKRYPFIPITLFFLCFSPLFVFSQGEPADIDLKTGKLHMEGAVNSLQIQQCWERGKSDSRSYMVLQFQDKVSPDIVVRLKKNGIELMNALSNNVFEAVLYTKPSTYLFNECGVQRLFNFPPSLKISTNLSQYLKTPDSKAPIEISILLHRGENSKTRLNELITNGFSPTKSLFQNQGILYGFMNPEQLIKIAEYPWVRYINTANYKTEPLLLRERGTFGVTGLTSTQSGRGLSGAGVIVGVGDNADVTTHIDLESKVVNRSPAPIGGSFHGTHVAGIVGGKGLVDEKWVGLAPNTKIINDYFDYIIAKTPTYVDDYGMTVTNNSYYNGLDFCPGNSEYNELSWIADQQIVSNPFLEHIFASGNDGTLTCSPYPKKFATIKSGYQTSKNVLTVGYCDIVGQPPVNNRNSSSGPVRDGRIKPEIIASGAAVWSTSTNNGYAQNWGTSASSPYVAGIWALLTERYKQLHNALPKSALLKSVLCNTATDRGNQGPDFENGFGWVHPQRALKAIEQNRYISGFVSQGQTQTLNLTVPSGLKQIKILLYWHDPAGVPYANKALQHDLDLKVTDNNVSYLPWVLNPAPASVNNLATRGIDRLNNIEQVTINNPGTTVTIEVTGFEILESQQEYFLTWDFIEDGIELLHPIGGERLGPFSNIGRPEAISWDANDNNTSPFTLEYSLDNGNTWTIIDANVGATEFRYFWAIPDVTSPYAKVRVTRNGTSLSSATKGNFTIMNAPNLSAAVPCEGYVDLVWNAVPNASDYEVFQIQDGNLQKITTTNGLSYRVDNLNRNTRYWFSVRPRIQDSLGKRGTSVSIIPSRSTACLNTAFDYDLKLDTLLSPGNGRKFTSTALGTNHPIRIRLKNLDNEPSSSNFTVSYQINNGTIITETPGVVIDSGGVYDYSFNAKADLAALGTYSVKVWVTQNGDNQPTNNEQIISVRHVDNPELILPHTETFESTGTEEYRKPSFALTNADRFDFNPSTSNGRLRTFINKGMAINGTRSLVLDAAQFFGNFNTNDATCTFNLSKLGSASGLRLDFSYRNQGQLKMPKATLWVRGKDTNPWILAYTFEQSQYKLDQNEKAWVNLEELLTQNGQQPDSSFQLRFNQLGRTSANNGQYDPGAFDLDDGYSFDDIRLSVATNDLSIKKIISPDTVLCDQSIKNIRVLIKNNSATQQNNVSVSYRMNNGSIITEQIPSIQANTELEYTFSNPVSLGTTPTHQLDVWVSFAGDNYSMNDSILNYIFYNKPVINTYPYIQGFEVNNGDFFIKDRYASWAWGELDSLTRTDLIRTSNGKKGWFTSLSYGYKPNEESYLYSPCFDLSQMQNPVLSFAHYSDQENNRDFHTLEYSVNQGSSWQRLGNSGEGTNWFDGSTQRWNSSLPRWHVSSIDIPTNAASVQFRFLLSSSPASQFEGIGIDDIHIFEKEFIYIGPDLINEELPVQGNEWTHFRKGGEIFASINPLGQNLGKCSVSVYMNTDPVRQVNNQYYLDRNFVIQSENPLTDSVLVRLYFTEDEVNTLLQANSCPTCIRFTDAFRASVTQYDGPNQFENNILNDGSGGSYTFFDSTKVLILPFNNGYLAEWKVRSLSEFWIHAQDFQLNQIPLPVTNINPSKPFIQNTWLSNGNSLFIQTAGRPDMQTMQVRLLNCTGQELLSARVRYQTQTIPTGTLASGIYFVEITDPKRQIRYINKLKKND